MRCTSTWCTQASSKGGGPHGCGLVGGLWWVGGRAGGWVGGWVDVHGLGGAGPGLACRLGPPQPPACLHALPSPPPPPSSHTGGPTGAQHVTLRALPGMADRCLRIGSAGKTFSFTAWKVCAAALAACPRAHPLTHTPRRASAQSHCRMAPRPPTIHCLSPPGHAQVGWATGPQDMIAALTKAKQFLTFTSECGMGRGVGGREGGCGVCMPRPPGSQARPSTRSRPLPPCSLIGAAAGRGSRPGARGKLLHRAGWHAGSQARAAGVAPRAAGVQGAAGAGDVLSCG